MKRHVLVGALALGVATLAIGCGDDDPIGPATETFGAILNGPNERPTPRTTPAVGTASFTLRSDTLRWTVAMTNITNVTAAHIHFGDANTAAEIILFLTGAAGSFTNSLITGLTTRSTFPAPNARPDRSAHHLIGAGARRPGPRRRHPGGGRCRARRRLRGAARRGVPDDPCSAPLDDHHGRPRRAGNLETARAHRRSARGARRGMMCRCLSCDSRAPSPTIAGGSWASSASSTPWPGRDA